MGTVKFDNIPSLDRLLDLTFYLDYWESKNPSGRPIVLGPVSLGKNIGILEWLSNKDLDFWNFDISINDYHLRDILNTEDNILYTSKLSDIYASLIEELEGNLEKNADYNKNKIFLIRAQKSIKQFQNRYYDIQIIQSYDESVIPLNGIWHNSVKLVSSDEKKHLPEIEFTKSVISQFLRQQKQFVDKARELIEGYLEIITESRKVNSDITKSIQTGLQWKKSDTDLLELIVALHASGSIYFNNLPMTRKQTIEFFENLFGITIKDPESKLSRATERKKDPAPYLSFLRQTFENYSKKKFE
jgi:hypothetical protein